MNRTIGMLCNAKKGVLFHDKNDKTRKRDTKKRTKECVSVLNIQSRLAGSYSG